MYWSHLALTDRCLKHVLDGKVKIRIAVRGRN